MKLTLDFTTKADGHKEAFIEYMASPSVQQHGNRAEFGAVVATGLCSNKWQARIGYIDYKRVCATIHLLGMEGDIATLEVVPSGPMGEELRRQYDAGVEFELVSRVYLNPDKSVKLVMNIDLVSAGPLKR